MGQAPFYYYNAESKNQHMGMYPMVPTPPSTPIYSRPNSSCSQPPTLMSNGPTSVMTPVASPPNMAHKPAIMLETDFCDSGYFPSTPPLSTSGSAVGSPKSFDVLQTPMNPMFSGMDGFDGIKDVLEPVEACVLDWSSCGSPPMTPVYLQSNLGKAPSLNNLNTTSETTSCPSLSPSPPPYARSVTSEQDVDFCDPRNLTVSATSNPTLAPEFSLSGLGEESKIEHNSNSDAAVAPQSNFGINPALVHGLPTFEEFSDLESEDDFVNSLVNLGDNTTADVGRPRACTGSSVVSLGHGSFIGDEDLTFDETETFQFPALPSPCSHVSEDTHQDKRQKKNCGKKADRTIAPIMAAAATESDSPQEQTVNTAASVSSESQASSGSESQSAPLPAPPTRRGRKQSLTEDPSKTFVCDLCNRRFRRQEHLKRHYRSLHTQEKPFECNECGKKFSRSDNLAQHARTHAGGAIALNLIDEADGASFDASMMSATSEDYNAYGKVLFQIASEVPGSSSDLSSEDGSDQGEGKKKRKRSD